MVSRLSELGVTVKHSQALEGIAAINGYPDWNHFSATFNSPLAPAVDDPASELIASLSDGGFSNLVREVASGFPYVCDQEFTLLCLGTGQGKSTILYHCMADAAERNATLFTWIAQTVKRYRNISETKHTLSRCLKKAGR